MSENSVLDAGQTWQEAAGTILHEVAEAGRLPRNSWLVIGCSTSEVMGQRIGTAGAEEVAQQLFAGFYQAAEMRGIQLAFQCCEHLNRALVIESDKLQPNFVEVSAVPIRTAGGAMASYAFSQLVNPCLIERIQAHAAIDIGETLIGMHLRAVAVPFRPSIRMIGDARVTAAVSRPKLIGGKRAVYEADPVRVDSTCE